MIDLTVQLILSLIALIGLAITVFGLPGIFLILVSLIVYGVYTDFSYPAVWVYVTFAVIAVISTFADNIAVIFGAKKFGGSKYAMIGAFIGAIIGFFVIPVVGILIGPFIGAFVADLVVKRDIHKAFKGAVGTIIGYFTGIVIKFVIALGLFIWLLTIIF